MNGELRVLLAGGGSGGSVTPLLAVAAALRVALPRVELLVIGTLGGPERDLARDEDLPFVGVQSGKLRRYWDVENVIDVGRFGIGFVQSLRIVRRFSAHVALGGGGFASVPPLAAARVFRIPVVIHQQDLEPGLANRLLAPLSSAITVSLPGSVAHFPAGSTTVTGNPVRPAMLAGDYTVAQRLFALEPGLPTVLVTGGGTGAQSLNAVAAAAVPELVAFCQVIHLTGRGRAVPPLVDSSRYHAFEFLSREMPHALRAADLVVSRAGMGTLAELAALGKPALIVPMPNSHQLANADAFRAIGAVEVERQEALTGPLLAERVRCLLGDSQRLAALSGAIRTSMPADAAERIGHLVLEHGGRREAAG